jgi:uncharacterized membrane protein YedE/YeeE
VTPSLVAFLAGVLFALGLGISGMTQPAKVLGFLDLGGPWDPSLAFVMIGAIGVHAPLARLILRRRAPLLVPAFSIPARRNVDARLLLGAAVFGCGWGLAGLCPGPAVTVLASGKPIALAFVGAMLAGTVLAQVLEREIGARGARRPEAAPTSHRAARPRELLADANGSRSSIGPSHF